jgi:hypothetical protein
MVAGCGPSNGGHSSQARAEASSLAANPQVKIDEKQAKTIASQCAARGHLFTKHGRKKIEKCMFPPAGKLPPGFAACSQKELVRDITSKAGRKQYLITDLPHCFLVARNKAAAK